MRAGESEEAEDLDGAGMLHYANARANGTGSCKRKLSAAAPPFAIRHSRIIQLYPLCIICYM